MVDKIQIAIERVRQFCPEEGYYLAFSGGKDSVAIEKLARMAGVPFDAHFEMTTVDPPEILRFIRDQHPEVTWHHPKRSMWQLIIDKGMPPTRRVRYCCEELKERGGIGRVVLLGVRQDEGSQRKKRQLVEICRKHPGKSYVNPIIEWTSHDVWQFIRQYNLPYCSLYDEGFKRIGCVLCPQKRKQRLLEVHRFPKFYKAYLRTFDKMLQKRTERGRKSLNWRTPQDVMDWWLEKDTKQLKRGG